MALFALTGLLSLGAGMGVGALIPVAPSSSQSRRKPRQPNPEPNVVHSVPAIPAPAPAPAPLLPKLEGGALDFDEFDKSLMKMIQTPAKSKFSTIDPAVAYDPKYYSPPSVVPLKTKTTKTTLQGGSHTSLHRKPQTQPTQQNQLNTSWF